MFKNQDALNDVRRKVAEKLKSRISTKTKPKQEKMQMMQEQKKPKKRMTG